MEVGFGKNTQSARSEGGHSLRRASPCADTVSPLRGLVLFLYRTISCRYDCAVPAGYDFGPFGKIPCRRT